MDGPFTDSDQATQAVSLDIFIVQRSKSDCESFSACLPDLEQSLHDHYFSGRTQKKPSVNAHAFTNATEFIRAIESVRAVQDACNPVLIVLDAFLPLDEATESEYVQTLDIGSGQLFFSWLRSACPAIPVVVLTSGGVNSASFAAIPGARLEILHRDALQNSAEVVNVLVRCLSNRWSTPFWEHLKRHAIIGNDTWFCPGHNKGNAYARSPFIGDFGALFAPAGGLALSSDVSVSIHDLGDLSEPLESNPMNASMRKSAEIFGAAFTLYSTNGTSTSNKVMLMALLRPGDVILVDRNCHKSVHQAIVIAGALPVYLHSAYNVDLGIWLPVSVKEIDESIQRMAKAKMLPRMLILTSCTYEGIMYPVSKIAGVCNSHGVLFYADEAWLPYGRFHPAYVSSDLPMARFNALGTGDGDGAHVVVQSTHKMLSALSQASMIHIGQAFVECFESGRVDWLKERFGSLHEFWHYLAEVNRYWLSTSPNYPMIASLDCATAQMAGEGMGLIGRLLTLAQELRELLQKQNANVTLKQIIGNQTGFEEYMLDPLKLTVALASAPRSFREVKKTFERHRISWDKKMLTQGSTLHNSVGGHLFFLMLAGIGRDHTERLKVALNDCQENIGWKNDQCDIMKYTDDQVVVLPRDAHLSTGEQIPIHQAGGRVACQMVVPYPPGIPTILPGVAIEPAEAKRIELLAQVSSLSVHGLTEIDGNMCVRVLTVTEFESLRSRLPAFQLADSDSADDEGSLSS